MVENEKTPIEVAIEELEAERDELDIAINMLKKRIGQPVESNKPKISPKAENGNISSGDSDTLRSDTFFGLGIRAAARKYLNLVREPKTTAEISNALLRGGVVSQSKNFPATLHTGLNRSKAVIRVKDKWGLLEWYPEMFKAKTGKN